VSAGFLFPSLTRIPDTDTVFSMLPKQENYALARRLAVEGLSRSNLKERAAQGGASYEESTGEAQVGFKYLGREILVSFPEGTVVTRNGQEPISLREEILILHYLETASGAPLTGNWVSFSEISGAAFYNSVFLMRCKSPLVKFFGEDPQALWSVAREVGGELLSLGDFGVKIRAFPFVPLTLVLWRGDDEFPAEGSILFDASVSEYLPLEDTVILAESVVWKLVKKKVASSEVRVKT
jgi:hypothetical protein